MRRRRARRAPWLIALAMITGSPLLAAEPTLPTIELTLESALELAREGSPQLLEARAHLDRVGAARALESTRLPADPELSIAVGSRRSPGESRTTDLEVELGQQFGTAGRRRLRVELASAVVVGAEARVRDVQRVLLRDVSMSFLRSLHAEQMLAMLRDSERIASEIKQAAEKRHEAGDVGILDPYAASMALARLRSELASAAAQRALAHHELASLLGIDDAARISVRGDLAQRRRFELSALLERAATRADIEGLKADIASVRTEERIAHTYRRPELAGFVGWAREEGADIASAGLSVTLPVRGQGARRLAVASAEANKLTHRLEARQRSARGAVRARLAAFTALDSAARQFESEDLPRLNTMLDLTRQSYDAGNLPVVELLVIQSEALATRRAYLDLALQTAIAAVELEATAGVLQ